LGGIGSYELQRRVDTGELRKIVNTNMLRVFHDDDLDLWWGAYYYVAKAYEGFNDSGKGYSATSLSNEIRLIQPPLVYVPNAFSPNDDYTNDVWGVSHAFVREFRMMVYNRWGEKVWDNDFKGTQWDGLTRGKSAMNDVFIWIVTYRGWDNKFYTQKGTVTVMP
jgi:gliding motility-associated-like protein